MQHSCLPRCFQITAADLPQLPQTSFQLLLLSAVPLAVRVRQLLLVWGSDGAQLERHWGSNQE